MNETNSIEQNRAQRIRALMPVLDQRYQAMRALLDAAQEHDIDESQFLLARNDLQSVVEVMSGPGLLEETDED